jgi:Putative Ig domain
MLHSINKFWLLLLLLVAGAPSLHAFSLLGPYENWQVTPTGFHEVGDDGGPKDLGDGFRCNTRNLFYACDESFSTYFGSNGIAAIDQAFAVFNSLTNLSSYTNTPNPASGPNLASPSGGQVPLSTSRINFTAEALNLQDVKSTAMSKIINFLGLAQPSRYVWNIENRFLPTPGPPCPTGENYVIVQRNFDPADYGYSSFVNGTLYNYIIQDVCTSPLPPVALAEPIAVDPNSRQFTTVADGVDAEYNSAVFWPGRYFTGLTKDDVGGLRYLMATNRMQFETVLGSSLEITTNAQPQVLVTSNLNLFYQQALTNNPAALLAIYTNLIITSTNSTLTNVVTTNVVAIATNILQTAGGVTLVLVTNFTTNAQTNFFYTFANLVIYTNFSNSVVETLTTTIGAPPGISVAGTLVTNTLTNTVIATNDTNGAFFILPADLCSGFTNIRPQLTNVIAITNVIPILNPLGLTNTNFLSASIVTFFTNYILAVNAVNCGSNTPAVFEGVDKINFQNVPFDSILSTNWGPVTNYYQLTAITNFTPVTETFRRVATQPDLTIEARDGIVGPANQNFITTQLPAQLNFNATVESTDGNGPGTIEPPIVLLFTKGGTAGSQFINGGGAFQTQGTATPYFFAWGSFDGTTNAPIIYPTNSSLQGLESMIFFQISTASQLNYSVGGNNTNNPFNFQLQANGGAQPYKWSLVPPNFGLPPGLTLNATNGVISGVSTNVSAGTVYDFVVQATDSSSPSNRVTQASLFITITP